MSYSYRSSSKDNNLSKLSQQKFGHTKEKIINIQKRDKLKELLVKKFMKKFGISNNFSILEQEISKFLEGENLNESDLIKFEEKLRIVLMDLKKTETLKSGLLNNENNNSLQTNEINNYNLKELILPDLNLNNDAISVISRTSKMSGASYLSKFNENNTKAKADEKKQLDFLKNKNPKPTEKFEFAEHGDEWNAIVAYNYQSYIEEKKQNQLKEFEIKKRIKDDLDNQIRHKLKKDHEESLKNKEYDQILLNHCDYLNELEIKRENDKKDFVLREKCNRDKQLKDERRKKKLEIIKDKKYDRETIKNIKIELAKEKEIQLKKKIDDNEILHKTLRENELNKIKQLDLLYKEKQDDIKATEDYGKMLDKQDQERREYFKKIERNSNNFINKMAGTVLVDLDKKSKEEDEKMKIYLEEKERRNKDEDDRKKGVEKDNKKFLKQYLDMQVEEKKRMNDFEKSLDTEQARIWRTDTHNFRDQEKDITEKVRALNFINSQYLRSQVDFKKQTNLNKKMSDHEYAINQDILEKIKTVSNNFNRTSMFQ